MTTFWGSWCVAYELHHYLGFFEVSLNGFRFQLSSINLNLGSFDMLNPVLFFPLHNSC